MRQRLVVVGGLALLAIFAPACGRRGAGGSGGDGGQLASLKTPEPGETGAVTAAGSAAAGGSAAADSGITEATKVSAAGCRAACEHRKQCGLAGEMAACTTDCTSVDFLFTEADFKSYTEADCKAVKSVEASFQATVGCKAACEHRKACLPEKSDIKECVGDCTQLRYGRKDLDAYAASDCANVKKVEPEFASATACLRTCKHVVECKVPGTLDDCTVECMSKLAKNAYTVEALQKVEAATCEVVKREVRITPRRPVGAGGRATGGGGGGGSGCMSRGAQDCGTFATCCKVSAGRQAWAGEAGLCVSPAVCFMPRR